jgi:uncharacterized membrane protein YeaQ/YmgE (transglycosylase-associated protein family)
MSAALVNILIIALVGAVIGGVIYYAPFITQPLKQWVLYVVGAVVVVLIILALIPLISAAA